VEQSGIFALHLLSEGNVELVRRFGLHSGHDGDKFADLAVTKSETGCPVLEETVGWIECRVETRLDIGDRLVYVAEVLQGRVTNFAPPLTVRRLMELSPPHMLAEFQRRRHLDSHLDAEAILTWRRAQANGGGEEGKAD
jgi:flavin reductase (DIM6/NTAB) family NADH-FMN oxidoreductase RutF